MQLDILSEWVQEGSLFSLRMAWFICYYTGNASLRKVPPSAWLLIAKQAWCQWCMQQKHTITSAHLHLLILHTALTNTCNEIVCVGWYFTTSKDDSYEQRTLTNTHLRTSCYWNLCPPRKKLHVVVPSSKQLLHKKQGSYHCSCAFSYGTKTSPLILNKDLLERARLTKINVTHNKVSTIKIISSAIMCKIENILLCT